MQTSEFDYHLPAELIAQTPAPARDQSRLLVLHRSTHALEHESFADFVGHLHAGDVLVLNNSRVILARLFAKKSASGGVVELLLLEEISRNEWWAMMKPAKRVKAGEQIVVLNARSETTEIRACVTGKNDDGHRRVLFEGANDIASELDRLGHMPLPHYVARNDDQNEALDRERYQTVFAMQPGSVAAPTAGLHFTNTVLDGIRDRGVRVCFVTLHVGAGTFAPVKSERVEDHMMHDERFTVPEETAALVNHAKAGGRRVIAVGTTSLRVLESVGGASGRVVAGSGRTRIFIHPPHRFAIVDALLTNFHLPRSTLLMLVCAFASPAELDGRDLVLGAYARAIQKRYRFYSYGDAMLLL